MNKLSRRKLMSTGLTFGTISSMYGLSAGYIDKTQFSLLVTTVILTDSSQIAQLLPDGVTTLAEVLRVTREEA